MINKVNGTGPALWDVDRLLDSREDVARANQHAGPRPIIVINQPTYLGTYWFVESLCRRQA